MGKCLYNKWNNHVYHDWEAFCMIKDMFLYVIQGNHKEFGIRNKDGWTPARVTHALLKVNREILEIPPSKPLV